MHVTLSGYVLHVKCVDHVEQFSDRSPFRGSDSVFDNIDDDSGFLSKISVEINRKLRYKFVHGSFRDQNC